MADLQILNWDYPERNLFTGQTLNFQWEVLNNEQTEFRGYVRLRVRYFNTADVLQWDQVFISNVEILVGKSADNWLERGSANFYIDFNLPNHGDGYLTFWTDVQGLTQEEIPNTMRDYVINVSEIGAEFMSTKIQYLNVTEPVSKGGLMVVDAGIKNFSQVKSHWDVLLRIEGFDAAGNKVLARFFTEYSAAGSTTTIRTEFNVPVDYQYDFITIKARAFFYTLRNSDYDQFLIYSDGEVREVI